MECPRCHNQKATRFYKVNDRYYCRYCIQFSRQYVDEYDRFHLSKKKSAYVHYQLSFELSHIQKKISSLLKENYINQKNSLVLAVCGSGKTEIVFELIKYALNQGERVCFCTPRKELCKELYDRFLLHFNQVDLSLVYGGHIENLESQFIICTTHQLYRFEKTGFHLIILDEADAFPFYGNCVLEEIFQRCVKGQYVKMSATIEKDDIQNEELLIMNRRYHQHDLPLPYKRMMPIIFQKYYIIYFLMKMKAQQKKVLIFTPLIKDVEEMSHFLAKWFQVKGIHSKSQHNKETIELLKNGQLDGIVCTTILERGITIEDVQVIVYNCEHHVFNARTLIQIAGRVGRKPNAYDGKICFLSSSYTKEMKKCIYTIQRLNRNV